MILRRSAGLTTGARDVNVIAAEFRVSSRQGICLEILPVSLPCRPTMWKGYELEPLLKASPLPHRSSDLNRRYLPGHAARLEP